MDKKQKNIFVYSYCLRTTLDENPHLKILNSKLAAQNEQMKSDYLEQCSKNLVDFFFEQFGGPFTTFKFEFYFEKIIDAF